MTHLSQAQMGNGLYKSLSNLSHLWFLFKQLYSIMYQYIKTLVN